MVYRILVALGLGLAVGASPRPAQAFCRTTTCAPRAAPASCGPFETRRDDRSSCLVRGAPLFWAGACTSFSLQERGSRAIKFGTDQPVGVDTLEGIVRRGFQAWSNADCGSGSPSITAVDLGRVECSKAEFNATGPNANIVMFVDEDWTHDPFAIALTTVSFDPETGELFDADLELNSEDFEFTPSTLEYVVIHEAGHFFGLDHSAEPGAVMYESYSFIDESEVFGPPELSPDDVAAICAAYPPDRSVSAECRPEPLDGYARDCGGNVTGSCSFSVSTRRRVESPGVYLAVAVLTGLGLRRGARGRERGGGGAAGRGRAGPRRPGRPGPGKTRLWFRPKRCEMFGR